jgi:phage terminase small subunit
MSAINRKHKAFVDEYLSNGMNGTRAYMKIYTSVKTEESAAVNASKLLRTTNVMTYIGELQKKTSNKLEITREEILQDLRHIKNTFRDKQPTHALKAIEILNRMLGFDIPKEDITRTDNTFQIKIVGVNKEDKPPIE